MRYFNDYSPMYYHASFWPEGIISLLINVLVWGLIAYFIVFLVRKMAMSHHHEGCCGMHDNDEEMGVKNDSYYLDIVKERYAKGEIDKRQYDEMKKAFSEEKDNETIETKSEK